MSILDWTQQNRNWFAAVKTEKNLMFVILTLIIAVAAFNLVSSLVMTVTDKQADIAILRTLGASPRSIMGIFVIQGAVIGLIGCAVGVILGVILALNVGEVVAFIEHLFGISFLPKGHLFHQRDAIRSAPAGRGPDWIGVSRFESAGHPLPELSCLAACACRSTALRIGQPSYAPETGRCLFLLVRAARCHQHAGAGCAL